MKIKSIAAICKRDKRIVLINKCGEYGGIVAQYISDGSAVYPICGLPELNEESILTIFDVPEKDREKWLVKCDALPKEINLEDTDESERPIVEESISILYAGLALKPLKTRRGLVFIDSRYLSPLTDAPDVLGFYERITPYGMPYIVVKAGFLLQAAIMPCDVIHEKFVERLQDMTRQCALSLELRKQETERAPAAAPEQCSMEVDQDTGETISEVDGGEE